jgi:hypothetical protein
VQGQRPRHCSGSGHRQVAGFRYSMIVTGGCYLLWERLRRDCPLLNMYPVNYAIRSSGPVAALTARRVRYGVGPDLFCQPSPSSALSLSYLPFPSLTFLQHPSWLRPRRAPLTPLPDPLVPTEPIRRGVRARVCQTTCGACQAHARYRLGARTLLTLAGKEDLSCSVQFPHSSEYT